LSIKLIYWYKTVMFLLINSFSTKNCIFEMKILEEHTKEVRSGRKKV